MISSQRLISAIEHWAFRPAPPHLLAILRLGFGLFLLFYWGMKAPHVPALYSDQGLWLPWPDAHWPVWLQLITSAPAAWAAWIVYGSFITCLTLFTVGLWMRPAALIGVTLYVYYWLISLHLFPTSYDRIFPFLLFLLAFSGADRALSVTMRLRHHSWLSWESICVLPQRLVALQIAFTYLGVGWQKMVLPMWQNGDILSMSLMGMWGTPLARRLLTLNLPASFYDTLTFLTMALEFWLPVGLWWPKWQWLFFAMGAVFHILIALLLGIWWFLVLIPAYIVFLEPEAVFTWCQRWLPIPDAPGPPPTFSPRHFGLGRHRTAAEQ